MCSVTKSCNVFGNKTEWALQIILLDMEEPQGAAPPSPPQGVTKRCRLQYLLTNSALVYAGLRGLSQ
jgi:hypothetical protein